jgi:predicted RNA-binding protein with TRAM domain
LPIRHGIVRIQSFVEFVKGENHDKFKVRVNSVGNRLATGEIIQV